MWWPPRRSVLRSVKEGAWWPLGPWRPIDTWRPSEQSASHSVTLLLWPTILLVSSWCSWWPKTLKCWKFFCKNIFSIKYYLLYQDNQPQPIISYHVFKLLTETIVTNIHKKYLAVLSQGIGTKDWECPTPFFSFFF